MLPGKGSGSSTLASLEQNITGTRGVLDDDDWRTNLHNDDWELNNISDIDIVAGKVRTATISFLS